MSERMSLCAAARAERMMRVIAVLERTGAVAVSCREAGINPALVCSWRHKYADFAKDWREALGRFETARLAALAAPHKPTRYARWSKAKVDKFIDELAASGNEQASARKVGMSKEAVYRLRRRDPAFRAAWASAVDQGYAQVEIGMIDEAINGIAPRPANARPAASERIRSNVYNAGLRRAAVLRGTSEDDAERDRNEALAAKWIADLRAAIARSRAAREAAA